MMASSIFNGNFLLSLSLPMHQSSSNWLKMVPLIIDNAGPKADPRSVDMHKIESPNRFRRMTLPHALNIAGSDLLSLKQTASRSERSASTSTSGYISNSDLNHLSSNAPGSGVIGKEEKKSKSKEKKVDNWKDKIGKRRASRPFRRAKTLLGD